jgi:galactose-1-phosphate uridylyltransferase
MREKEASCYQCSNLFFIPDSIPPGYKVRCFPNEYPGPERDVPRSGLCDCGKYRYVNEGAGNAEWEVGKERRIRGT